MTVLSFSRHVMDNFTHTAFEDDEEQALTDFEVAVRKYAPEDGRPYVLMPAFRDARLFARYRERFEPLIQVAAPDIASIEMVSPKDHFARLLTEADLPGPATRVLQPGTFANGLLADAAIKFPLMAKPTDGVGGRGVTKIKDPAALNDYLRGADSNSPVLLQEVVEGDDYCVSVIADHGELAGMVVYRNLAQFPRDVGAGAVRETVAETPFENATRALLKATRWNGVGEIDFRWNGDPSTPPRMIEMNPRYWAGLYHSMSSGVDFPWLAFQLAAGRPLPPADPHAVRQGHRTRTPGAWILSAAEDLAASDPDLGRAAEAWAQSRGHASRKEILAAANRLLESASAAARGAHVFKDFRKRLDAHKDLPSELDFDDDPAVGLGILFVVSSLLKHHELPAEFRYAAPQAADKTRPRRPGRSAISRRFDRGGRPIIGVTKPDEGEWLAYCALHFAIRMAGGEAVAITSKAPRDAHSIDGLLFGGGSDVFPDRYGGAPKAGHRYDLARDDMEASWAEAALEHDVPVLGVCRGMQMLNVLEGGTLFPDLSHHEEKYPTSFLHRIFYRKTVFLAPDGWLARLSGYEQLKVNSIHNQALKDLGPGFKVIGAEANGLIQAIEHETRSFCVGVQFHPEFLLHRAFARRIFHSLVEAARFRRARLADSASAAI
ncbi:gamma-glutamyl-gamma-aminobutyrate hydrolase family protein [Xanthobacter autotrophicus]|uniref:gamma-glutamyl-gamma-aminobutyrate hydrolase family protein n=1 Tax=Xanthobacter autotrophicus TaxID=280 RepID=UPI0037280FAC